LAIVDFLPAACDGEERNGRRTAAAVAMNN
jgi:hypothetical protein